MKKTMLAVALLAYSSAQAALVSLDYLAVGDGLVTRDDNGLEWLDWTETVSLSHNYVTDNMGAGEIFEGWRYAAREEVAGLFDSAGGIGPYTGWSTANNGIWAYMAGFLGELYGDSGEGYSRVITGDAAPLGPAYWTSFAGDWPPNYGQHITADYLRTAGSTIDRNQFGQHTGSALVREVSPVPIPAAAWLFASALGVFGYLGKRKASA